MRTLSVMCLWENLRAGSVLGARPRPDAVCRAHMELFPLCVSDMCLLLTHFTETAKDLSAWFNLFADLDPLSNPDAIGKTDAEHELHSA